MMMTLTSDLSLAQQVLAGQKRAIARLITALENQNPKAWAILNELYPHTGQAHVVGVTGPPGTGKSSLVNKLAQLFRSRGQTVAIVAVDPTSPFSGGAILGDRVRMRELSGDPGVFIRSLASRGSLGGLSGAVGDAVNVLDAAGFEVILIETVGAGQAEVEIVKTAQTVLVVEVPGLGDEIQAIKAGILEIADIFVVNKADLPGVERAESALKTMLGLGHPAAHTILHHGRLAAVQGVAEADPPTTTGWQIPILRTVATKGEGLEPVVAAIAQHRHYLHHSGQIDRRNRTRLMGELETALQTELLNRLLQQLSPDILATIIEQVTARTLSPRIAVEQLVNAFLSAETKR